MADDGDRLLQQFREAEGASRVTVLTLITPFRAALDRFTVIETADGATLLTCRACRLNAASEAGERVPVSPDVLARFQHGIDGGAAAWNEDDVPEGAHDGLTIIVERASAAGYDITHMVSPRGNSPHMRLLRAWTDAFPVVSEALR